MILPNLVGPLTGPMSGEDYVRVLVERQATWVAANPSRPGFPPLLEWFIQPGEEELVVLPESTPAPKPLRKPRVYRSAESLRAERDRVRAEMDRVAGIGEVGDRAAANLSPHSRSRAAARAGRRRFAQMDRALERYAALRRRLEQLDSRIAAAERREAETRGAA